MNNKTTHWLPAVPPLQGGEVVVAPFPQGDALGNRGEQTTIKLSTINN